MSKYTDLLSTEFANKPNGVPNATNCSGFLKAVASKIGTFLPDVRADDIIDYMSRHWTPVSISTACSYAQLPGRFVVAGLKYNELTVQNDPSRSGHVAILVAGPLYHGKYPRVWCGGSPPSAKSPGGQSKGNRSVGEVWLRADRDKVHYFYDPVCFEQIRY